MDAELTEWLVDFAIENGASAAGVASAAPFMRELEKLHDHKRSGRSGRLGFTYRDPDVAADVTKSLPWARSLVVLGHNYLGSAHRPSDRGATIGRFATQDNYDGVSAPAEAVAEHLRTLGARAEVLIDDNRLLDRAAAVRAGIGWQGKSTMVLAPGHGPWLLLGSVVTDLALAPTEPMSRDCGTCDLCMPACPTGAISHEGLDSRRCLSAWLQTPGFVPQWIRPRLDRRIYGCDDCLTACPPGQRSLMAAGQGTVHLDFEELLSMSDETMLDRFSWWFVPRRDGRYLRRNILVAAGNSGEAGARAAIRDHLAHDSSMIRGHAAWAIARSKGASALITLRRALETETAPEAIGEMVMAILMVERPETHREMLALDEWVGTTQGLEALGLLGPERPDFATDDLGFLIAATMPTTIPEDVATPVHIRGEPDSADPRIADLISVHDPLRRLEAWKREAKRQSETLR